MVVGASYSHADMLNFDSLYAPFYSPNKYLLTTVTAPWARPPLDLKRPTPHTRTVLERPTRHLQSLPLHYLPLLHELPIRA